MQEIQNSQTKEIYKRKKQEGVCVCVYVEGGGGGCGQR